MKEVKVVIAGLARCDDQEGMVILLDNASRRALPLWGRLSQGMDLYIGLKQWPRPRPLTFHLMTNLLKAAGAKLLAVHIGTLEHTALCATVSLRVGDAVREVDASPIDAVILAAYAGSPIYVAQSVMAQAGIPVAEAVWETAGPEQMLDGPALDRFVQKAQEKRVSAARAVDEVVEGVYIGGVSATAQGAALRDQGVTRVLKLYTGDEPTWPDGLFVYENAVHDGQFVPREKLERGVTFIRQQRRAGERVLVACWMGISRSSTFVLAYLVEELGYDLHDAWNLLRKRHPPAWPEPEMWASLLAHYELPYSMADIKNWLKGYMA